MSLQIKNKDCTITTSLKEEKLNVANLSGNFSGGKLQRWLRDSAFLFLSSRDFLQGNQTIKSTSLQAL